MYYLYTPESIVPEFTNIVLQSVEPTLSIPKKHRKPRHFNSAQALSIICLTRLKISKKKQVRKF